MYSEEYRNSYAKDTSAIESELPQFPHKIRSHPRGSFQRIDVSGARFFPPEREDKRHLRRGR